MAVLAAEVGYSRPDLPSPRALPPWPPPMNRWSAYSAPAASRPDTMTATGSPVGDCTAPGAASARARNTAGARYHPVRTRAATAAGRVQFTIEPSGAVTVNGR